ncbi:MAG: glycosyltransferase family 39 protein [Elusimicrobiota bacterium]
MKKHLGIFFAILIFALLFRTVGANFNLPYVYTTEEYKVINYALGMGRGDLNPHFFNYPSLYLYFTLFVSGIIFVFGKIFGVFASVQDFAISFVKNPTTIYFTMRLISGLWSTATVVMTYFTAKELFGKTAGLISMAILSSIPSILISAHEVRPSMPSMFLVITAFYLLVIFLRKNDHRYFYFSAALIGLATSIYYNAFFLTFPLIASHFFNRKKISILDLHLWKGLLLIPLFFIAGTPYSLLDFKSFYTDFSAHSQGALSNLPRGLPAVLSHYLFIGHNSYITPFLGFICFSGLAFIILKPSPQNLLTLITIISFTFPAAMYFSPGIGYLFPAFPLFIASGAFLIDKIRGLNKFVFSVILLLCFVPSVWESTELIRTYLIEDTRTTAKEWIEKNIKPGSKILIDVPAHSPPIKETKKQTEELYRRAVAENHYKKEYLKLQLETYSTNDKTYEIWQIFRKPLEISGTADIHLILQAQKVQHLIDVSGGWNDLRKKGVKYFIFNDRDMDSALNSKNPVLTNFYLRMRKETKLLAHFDPPSRIYPSPIIEIRQLK